MSNPPDPARLQALAELMIARVEGDNPAEAAQMVEDLRNARQYPLLLRLAEAIGRKRPDEHRVRRLQAQALIEQGQITAAIDVLKRLAARLKSGHPEWLEAHGLLGRAYKQIYADAKDRGSPGARAALQQAIRAYRRPFEADAANTWHGVNLVALLARAEREGQPLPRGMNVKDMARRVGAALDLVPASGRDEWFLPTRAEVAVALEDWAAVQALLKAYVATPAAQAFMIQSTLRQFTQVWDLERDAGSRGAELVAILRARLLQVSQGELQLSPQAVAEARRAPEPSPDVLEAVLGEQGVRTWQWWRQGLECATAVCVVRSKLGERIGSGWMVKATDLALPASEAAEDQHVVVTNFHVVNPQGLHNGLTPESAEIVFEAVNPNQAYGVRELLWSSPPEQLDVAILRLHVPVVGVQPLTPAKALPVIDSAARVYIIGHPGGRSLAFSFQDNELIDHEGPPSGKPAVDGVCRVHYRAPTEGGSSGSPVFNAGDWKVIALHHSGGRLGMPMLNGRPGTYAANEGIALQSICDALRAWQATGG